MDDVMRAARERAARPKGAPIGTSFQSERQREKKALVKQLESQDGSHVRMIAAAGQQAQEDRILRVAAYCRVSTDDIDQAISIRMQIDAYMKKIRETPGWKYAGCYVDDGFSGTNTSHRQGFMKLMKDAMDGKIDMIITKAVSRFARNLLDCIGWVEKLKEHDPPIRVFFEQENLDTMAQSSNVILFVLAMVAQEESHMKSEAMLLSLEWRFSRGRFLTPRLFGYDKVEVPDGFGGRKKVLIPNESEARVVKWMYSMLVNGGQPDEIAAVLTELAVPTGGRRRDGTLNTHWSASGVTCILRNERYCGDVLARKTYTPNYKDHKSKKNNGKKNKYYQPDHHEAIVSRATWNAAQRILNSRKYGHEGSYLPMRIIDHGALTGYISMNLTWAGFDYEDCSRASRIAMGLLDGELETDLGKEFMPEGGKRIGGSVDDYGIAQIARELTVAEQQIKDELEGRESSGDEDEDAAAAARTFQVVNGNMFSHISEPAMRITSRSITFSKSCLLKLPETEMAELLFNPVERTVVIRSADASNPNAFLWDTDSKRSAPLSRVFFDSMGWEAGYSFRVACHTLKDPDRAGNRVLVFDLDNYVGRSSAKKEETIISARETEEEKPPEEPKEEARSYYYPPDDDEPQEIREIEERFQLAVEENKRIFGTPVATYETGSPGFETEDGSGWDLMAQAKPLEGVHTVDPEKVENLLKEIKEDPPLLPQGATEIPGEPVVIESTGKEA